MGRNSRLTTKIHAVVDALGNPLRIHLTAGNVNDIVSVCGLIEGLLADKLLVDRAYDANKLLALAERQNHEAVIPPMPGRLIQREYETNSHFTSK
ncbi:transposase [uncultured Bilophila sp.]|uniref:transposase n=1 Tax=uncultured Bilophila sp. TaxID=529385 RepID=UPI0035A60246